MSENERKELSEKLHFGLALAERRMPNRNVTFRLVLFVHSLT